MVGGFRPHLSDRHVWSRAVRVVCLGRTSNGKEERVGSGLAFCSLERSSCFACCYSRSFPAKTQNVSLQTKLGCFP
jgi:hypothetical protein